MRYLSIIIPILLMGCAPTLYWQKAGSTQQDFNQDKYSCLQESSAIPSAPGLMAFGGANPMILPVDLNQGNRNNLANACMNSKGWILAPAPPSDNTPLSTNNNSVPTANDYSKAQSPSGSVIHRNPVEQQISQACINAGNEDQSESFKNCVDKRWIEWKKVQNNIAQEPTTVSDKQ